MLKRWRIRRNTRRLHALAAEMEQNTAAILRVSEAQHETLRRALVDLLRGGIGGKPRP